jgi:hypothetical protein
MARAAAERQGAQGRLGASHPVGVMRAVALEASVPGTVATNARIHGGPDVAQGALPSRRDGPIQMDFILRRFVEMAQADPALRERQPWKARVF